MKKLFVEGEKGEDLVKKHEKQGFKCYPACLMFLYSVYFTVKVTYGLPAIRFYFPVMFLSWVFIYLRVSYEVRVCFVFVPCMFRMYSVCIPCNYRVFSVSFPCVFPYVARLKVRKLALWVVKGMEQATPLGRVACEQRGRFVAGRGFFLSHFHSSLRDIVSFLRASLRHLRVRSIGVWLTFLGLSS
jgi:hypothetical protein